MGGINFCFPFIFFSKAFENPIQSQQIETSDMNLDHSQELKYQYRDFNFIDILIKYKYRLMLL